MTPSVRIPGFAYLLFSVVVFGAAASVIRILNELGAQYPIDGRNAISFCNLFFAGNACAAIVLYAVHRKQWNKANLAAIGAGEWIKLFILAFMANGVAPWLFFLGVSNTTVTSVVLVSQLEAPLVLVLSWLIFAERVGVIALIGGALCLVGIALTVFLGPGGGDFMIGRGETYAAGAAMIYGCSSIMASPTTSTRISDNLSRYSISLSSAPPSRMPARKSRTCGSKTSKCRLSSSDELKVISSVIANRPPWRSARLRSTSIFPVMSSSESE
ncbi:MAG TPA: hypothetical protein DCS82_03690 [Rhodospirillaceae bacterium]|nr:hypothetical protein [Rhodospirillaceae bacterium]HAT34795.1 hypothetical protein [Rhodospirillaceae bacterium]